MALPTAADLRRICMTECRAQCCQGPLVLRLEGDEVDAFKRGAEALGIEATLRTMAGGGARLRFADHPGERCPMLESRTHACRIYADRPARCRAFPEWRTPGCALSERLALSKA